MTTELRDAPYFREEQKPIQYLKGLTTYTEILAKKRLYVWTEWKVAFRRQSTAAKRVLALVYACQGRDQLQPARCCSRRRSDH